MIQKRKRSSLVIDDVELQQRRVRDTERRRRFYIRQRTEREERTT